MFDNGVSLKTIAATLGQNTTRSTEKYVKANKSHISRTMDEVEKKLYGKAGTMVKQEAPLSNEAKVISVRSK